ncbi:MAG: succinate dehydrogenase, cytochrome b556 subunit [Candidatus Marinimicrobia bacterium]|nr:succinate dehydrogenase, cytochrome b556 subunit [Candidatus Neomarinimicrobiota bacterium]
MSHPRDFDLKEAFMYKIREGMLSWLLHKVTGVSIVGFLIFHIWGMSQMSKGPEAFNAVIETYKTPLFRVGEVLLLGAILFHGINGMRLILGEFTAWAMRKNKMLAYATYIIAGLLFIIGGLLMWRAEG